MLRAAASLGTEFGGMNEVLANLYAATGNPAYLRTARQRRAIVTFFWDRVVHHRSFVTGGNSDNEAFFPGEEFSKHLGRSSAETCNTYNMLKLTRHIFEWSPSAEAMDYYERGLFNQGRRHDLCPRRSLAAGEPVHPVGA